MKLMYTVIIEEEDGNVGALVPDGMALGLGGTIDEARADLRVALADAIASYLEGGDPLPEPAMTIEQARAEFPHALIETVEVEVPDFAGSRGVYA